MWPEGTVGRPPASPAGRGPVPQSGRPLSAEGGRVNMSSAPARSRPASGGGPEKAPRGSRAAPSQEHALLREGGAGPPCPPPQHSPFSRPDPPRQTLPHALGRGSTVSSPGQQPLPTWSSGLSPGATTPTALQGKGRFPLSWLTALLSSSLRHHDRAGAGPHRARAPAGAPAPG